MESSLMMLATNQTFAIVIAAYLIWWVTRKLNGKLDRLAISIEKLNSNIELLVSVINKNSDKRDGE